MGNKTMPRASGSSGGDASMNTSDTSKTTVVRAELAGALEPFPNFRFSMTERLAPGTPVAAVTTESGRIFIAGAGIYRFLAGSSTVEHRAIPAELGFPISIAAEPTPPHRIAFGAEGGDVVIFTDTQETHTITIHPFTDPRGQLRAIDLAWVTGENGSALFALTDDGALHRMQDGGWGGLVLPPVRAIARDELGGFAALTVVDGVPKVYVSRDGGDTWQLRKFGLDLEVEPDAPASLAIAGSAVAITVGDSGPILSRSHIRPVSRYPGLDRARSVAFQGHSRESWLWVGLCRSRDELANVTIITAKGEPFKAMEFEADDLEPLDLGPIHWDESRNELLISSRLGLLGMGPEWLGKPRARRARARAAKTAA